MKPLDDKILIKVDKPEEISKSGIYLGESAKQYPPYGTVLAIGDSVENVKVGDRVMFERYASIILDNDERLCQEKHIYGILDDGKK